MSHQLPAGTILHHRYRIDAVIGQGGFGITYKAIDPGLKQVVCVKELFPSGLCVRGPENTVVFQGKNAHEFPAFRNRFIKEARELARFRHPNIVRVSEVFEANQTAYFVMDFVEGETLRERVTREGRLNQERALPLMQGLLDAVEEVHRAGLLHRDIKPDNVLIETGGKVVLIDFGSAKEFEDGKTLSQTAILTPGYAPLEQYSDTAQRGTYTDIYALGATFYFLLTGKKPLAAIDRQDTALAAPHSLFADVSEVLSSAIMLALNLRPADRFQTVGEMRKALDKLNLNVIKKNSPDRMELNSEIISYKSLMANVKKLPSAMLMSILKETDTGKIESRLNDLLKSRKTNYEPRYNIIRELETLLSKCEGMDGFLWKTLNSKIRSELHHEWHNNALYWLKQKSPQNATEAFSKGLHYKPNCETCVQGSVRDKSSDSKLVTWKVKTAFFLLGSLILSYAVFMVSNNKVENNETVLKIKVDETKTVSESSNSIPEVIQRLQNNMVFLQGSVFWMGCTSEEDKDYYADEKPSHIVTINGFRIGKYEVTQAEWQAVMGNNPSYFQNCPSCPVENVSWNDANDFIYKLNELTGGKFRLPTEAEWEFAARGGNATKFYTGNCLNTDQANYDGNYFLKDCSKGVYRERTMPVGTFSPNGYGLYDICGNVWEWCSDWFGEYGSDAAINPLGPSNGSHRVLRGGSWFNGAKYCRVSNRGGDLPGSRDNGCGFRLASPGD
jgi:formylglycine-generating enzyme required for sulfatase activity/predicted Ser/Thr protein kinase